MMLFMIVGVLQSLPGAAFRSSPVTDPKIQHAECARLFEIHTDWALREHQDTWVEALWEPDTLRPVITACNRFVDYPVKCPTHLGAGSSVCAEVALEVGQGLRKHAGAAPEEHCHKWDFQDPPFAPAEVTEPVKELPTTAEKAQEAAQPAVWQLLKEQQDAQDAAATTPSVPHWKLNDCMSVFFAWLSGVPVPLVRTDGLIPHLLKTTEGKIKGYRELMMKEENGLGFVKGQCMGLGFPGYEAPSKMELRRVTKGAADALEQRIQELAKLKAAREEKREKAHQDRVEVYEKAVASAKAVNGTRARMKKTNEDNAPWFSYCGDIAHSLKLFDFFCAIDSTCNKLLRETEGGAHVEAFKQFACAPCDHPDPLPDFHKDRTFSVDEMSPNVQRFHKKHRESGSYD